MEVKVLTPQSIWQDYDPTVEALQYKELNQDCLNETNKIQSSFCAIDDGKNFAKIYVEQYFNNIETDMAIIIIPDYHKTPSKELLLKLAKTNSLVIVPDLYGKVEETEYSGAIEFGHIEKAGDHIKKVCPSAYETSQYLYTKVIRRVITLAKDEFLAKKILVVGIEDGVEIAMQVAGVDKRVDGICCLNGGGYREYINYNKYENTKKLDIDESMMAWLMGVASVAYAKSIKCPFLLLAGTNSSKHDIDRIINLFALLECQSYLDITPRTRNFADDKAFRTFLDFIERIKSGEPFELNIPEMYIRINTDGKVYLNAMVDSSMPIKNVKFYYCYDEINHLYRDWSKEKAIFLSDNEYIANVGINVKNCPFYAYVRVEYENGMALSSVEEYLDTTGLDISCEKEANLRIIYNSSKKYANFAETTSDEFLYTKSISIKENKLGLKGICSGSGSLVTYAIGHITKVNDFHTLQIDIRVEEEIDVAIKLLKVTDKETEYKVQFKALPGADIYKDYRFEVNAFKELNMMPLDSFKDVKVISIESKGESVISNILFI